MKILGISAYYHDSAAVLLEDDRILAAAQEERFTRLKHDESFPSQAVKYCLDEAGCSMEDIEHVVFYEKPLLTFDRLFDTYFSFAPRGIVSFCKAVPVWFSEKLYQKRNISDKLRKLNPHVNWNGSILFSTHHHSHAASAFFPSPFNESIILTMDGVGEWATTTISLGRENSIKHLKEIRFPHSLGLLYSAFTYFLGFKVNSGEYKVMGLAPYGEPVYKDLILKELIHVKNDGSFRMNIAYFNYCTGLTMTNKKFAKLFNLKKREPHNPINAAYMNLAASVQAVVEEIIIKMVTNIRDIYKIDNLCLAGGVALNCVVNGKLLKENIMKNIWIQPAAGDAGGALGAAYSVYYEYCANERKVVSPNDRMSGCYLGPAFSNEEIAEFLTRKQASFTVLPEEDIYQRTCDALKNDKVVGWFQGRMEFGPRALGARSILADPRSSHMQSTLNLKIKYRESFRPFAPVVLMDDVRDWFELPVASPYMLYVAAVKEQHRRQYDNDPAVQGLDKLKRQYSTIPAVTHVDYSARIQTVNEESNERLYRLLCRFKKETDCPVLVNTSFNVRGEPIVCTPEDAFNCFINTEMDVLVLEDCFLEKKEQNRALHRKNVKQFELD